MADLRWVDDDTLVRETLLAELGEPVRLLYKRLEGSRPGLELIRLLEQQANTLMSLEDLSYRLGQPYDIIAEALHLLIQLQIAHRVEVLDLVVFGITKDAERRQVVRDLLNWQDLWSRRLERIRKIVEGFPA